MMSNEFTRADCVVQLKKCEEDIYTIIKGFSSTQHQAGSISISSICTCLIHKVLILNEGVISVDLQKQKYFGLGQIYTALSRVTNYDKLFCKGELNTSAIRVDTSALEENKRLHQNCIFDTIQKVANSEDATTLLLLNV